MAKCESDNGGKLESLEVSDGNTKSETKNNKKRQQCKSFCFTINNYEFEEVKKIRKYFKKNNLKYIFQEEKGENGTKHLQGVVTTGDNRKLDFNVIHKNLFNAHLEPTRSLKASIKYCCKLDSRIGKVYTNMKVDIPIKLIDPLEGKKYYYWQQFLINIIMWQPDDRQIFWIYDYEGNSGKTSFCKHLCMNFSATYVGGRAADAIFALSQSSYCPLIFLFNVTRSEYNSVSYKAIESIKDGICFSTKYESKQMIFNIPHVFVFCNYEPDYNQLSADRWQVIDINKI